MIFRFHNKNYFLLLFGICAGLVLAESTIRNFVYFREIKAISEWQAFSTQRVVEKSIENEEFSVGHIIQISEDPGIIYELIPNLSGIRFKGKPLVINKYGFRGPAYEPRPGKNAIRVIGVGDSVTFGWGVSDEETFLRLLEEKLNSNYKHNRFEVINTGVPGYNTAMEVATLESKGIGFRPDLVIVTYVDNDPNLPNFIAPGIRRNYFTLKRSYLIDLLKVVLSDDEKKTHSYPLRSGAHVMPHEDAPLEYQYMLGKQGVRLALSRLSQLKRQHGFDILVFAYSSWSQLLIPICAELELPLLQFKPVREKYLTENNIKEYVGSELTISKTDAHPSALQHRLIAEALYERLNGNWPNGRLD